MGESSHQLTLLAPGLCLPVASSQDSPYFTAPERASLALVEVVLQPSADGERVSDELYAQAAEYYEPKALGAGSPAAATRDGVQARRRAITAAHLVPLVRAGANFESGVLVERGTVAT